MFWGLKTKPMQKQWRKIAENITRKRKRKNKHSGKTVACEKSFWWNLLLNKNHWGFFCIFIFPFHFCFVHSASIIPEVPTGSLITEEVAIKRFFFTIRALCAWLTHCDSCVHAESFYQHIVEDDSQQSHQDVCETHVKHYGCPWNTHKKHNSRTLHRKSAPSIRMTVFN